MLNFKQGNGLQTYHIWLAYNYIILPQRDHFRSNCGNFVFWSTFVSHVLKRADKAANEQACVYVMKNINRIEDNANRQIMIVWVGVLEVQF